MLTLYIGPMCSGKTTRMLLQAENHARVGRKVVIVSHSISENTVSSRRIGDTNLEVIKVEYLFDLYKYPQFMKADFVGVDEVHFFTDADELRKIASMDGKIVVAAGLSGTFKRNPWDAISTLIPLSDDVKFMKAVCVKCTGKIVDAPFSLKMKGDPNIVTEVDKTFYHPTCDAHFKSFKRKQNG